MKRSLSLALLCIAAVLCVAGSSRRRVLHQSDFNHVPTWAPTYSLRNSTILYTCNYSGFFDAHFAAKFAIVDFDWSNAKDIWTNNEPMNCEELLVEQAAMVKAVNPNTIVMTYRNLVKALPWFTTTRLMTSDPALGNWFLKFKPNGTYHVPNCDKSYQPEKCTELYHDQCQSPQYNPKFVPGGCNGEGDGGCYKAPCSTGKVPSGEYLWDHRNASMQEYLANVVVFGPMGMGNENISGYWLDDSWADSSQPVQPWQPSEGFCDHSPIGGPTEIDYYCTQDMGLTQADTTAITTAHQVMITNVYQDMVSKGGFAWQLFSQFDRPPSDVGNCSSYFTGGAGDRYYNAAMFFPFADELFPLQSIETDVALFHMVRGDHAWIGYGWLGCAPCYSWEYPSLLDNDYGKPLNKSYHAVTPTIFRRYYEHAYFTYNCSDASGTITPTS